VPRCSRIFNKRRRTSEETADSIDSVNPTFSGKLGQGRINPLAALESIYIVSASGNYANLTLRPAPSYALHGRAEKLITGALQQFRIIAWGLTPRSKYRLLINGRDISTTRISSSNFGGLAIELSNGPAAEAETGWIHLDLPLELNPVTEIKQVNCTDRSVLRPISPIADGSDQFISNARRSPRPVYCLNPQEGRILSFPVGTKNCVLKETA
jgi:hypothetical protein